MLKVPVESTVPEPSVTPPLVIVTVPALTAETVALIATGEPYVLVLGAVTVTVGEFLFTVTVVPGDVAGLLFASPGVEAVIVSVPACSEIPVSVAIPPVIGAVPSTVVPL